MAQKTELMERQGRYDDLDVVSVTVLGGIATVYLNNPPINLYDPTLVSNVSRVGRLLAEDPEVRVVVVRSAVPGFFIAHADATQIKATNEKLAAGEPLEMPKESTDWPKMLESWRTMPKPTIAVIEGRCGGGGSEFAISCDMQFAAAETAIFNQWEVSLGIVAGAGGLTRLARKLGRSRALEALLGCDDFGAQTAERYGWINRALPAAELNGFVDRLARRIAGFPPEAVAAAKAAILERVDFGGPVPAGEAEVVADLSLAMSLIGRPETGQRVTRFLERGGQTVEGETRFGELIGEL